MPRVKGDKQPVIKADPKPQPREGRALWRLVATYTALFMLTGAFTFHSFLEEGRGLVARVGFDGYQQYYLAFVYVGRWLRSGVGSLLQTGRLQLPLYNWGIGLGDDVIATLHYYGFGDPLTLLSALVPEHLAEHLMTATVVARMWLAGLAFLLYGRRMRRGPLGLLCGAISYAYSGFALVNLCLPVFLDALVCLPLVLLGLEVLLSERRPVAFVLAVSLSAVCSFYFAFMLGLMTLAYAMTRLLRYRDARRLARGLAATAACGLVGLALAGVVLLPVLAQYLSSSRTGVRVLHAPLFSRSYYASLPAALMAPRAGADGLTGPRHLFVGAPLLLGLVPLHARRGSHAGLRAATVLAALGLAIPAFGSAMNGFGYVTDRWVFAAAFLNCFVFATELPCLLELSLGECVAVSAAAVLAAAYARAMGDAAGALRTSVLLLAAAATVAVLASWRGEAHRVRSGGPSHAAAFCLAALALWATVANGTFALDRDKGDLVDDYQLLGSAYEALGSHPLLGAGDAAEGQIVRIDSGDYVMGDLRNVGLLSGVSNLSHYWSLANGFVGRLQMDMGLPASMGQQNTGYDGRTYLDELLCVRWCCGDALGSTSPLGYRPPSGREAGAALPVDGARENPLALPIGYTYARCMGEGEYYALAPERRQEALLQSVVVEDQELPALRAVGLSEADVQSEQAELACRLRLGDGVQMVDDTTFLVSDTQGRVHVEALGTAEDAGETYLVLEGMSAERLDEYELYEDGRAQGHSKDAFERLSEPEQRRIEREHDLGDNTWNGEETVFILYAVRDDLAKRVRYTTPYYRWTTGQCDFVVNLGPDWRHGSEVEIDFPRTGIYRFEGLRVVRQGMAGYAQKAQALRQDVLQGVEVGIDRLSGTIDLTLPKALVISLPYSGGWSATVDGRPVRLLRANTAFMALPLEAGSHTVELRYITPGLRAGACLTLAGAVALYLLMLRSRRGMDDE